MVSRQVTLIGKTGFLGRAIESQLRSFSDPWSDVAVPEHRSFVSALLQTSSGTEAAGFVLEETASEHDWIFAAGLVDSRADRADLDRINVDAPLRLLERLRNDPRPSRHRLVTFGSVLERRSALAESNAYLHGKARLFDTWRRRHDELPVTWIHIQLHTLYGGTKPPHPSMFTGQMLAALVTGSEFKMSGGEQLREYHHVDDIARSVVQFLASHLDGSRALELSSGCAIPLRDLARSVFEHFHRLDLLSLGAQPTSVAEVYQNEYHRSPYLLAHREPCDGVVAWFEELGVRRQ